MSGCLQRRHIANNLILGIEQNDRKDLVPESHAGSRMKMLKQVRTGVDAKCRSVKRRTTRHASDFHGGLELGSLGWPYPRDGTQSLRHCSAEDRKCLLCAQAFPSQHSPQRRPASLPATESPAVGHRIGFRPFSIAVRVAVLFPANPLSASTDFFSVQEPSRQKNVTSNVFVPVPWRSKAIFAARHLVITH